MKVFAMTIARKTLVLVVAVASVSGFLPTRTRPRVTFSGLFTVVDKPGRVAIEEAAGQRAVTKDTPRIAEQDAVHGFTTKTEAECTNYHCMADDPELKKKLERITRKRPYPLFLMEKAAGILDGALKPIFPQSDSSKVEGLNGVINGHKTKEHLVVLGTGWGSAALIQGIDNERYDVTVISPRNYFLFTPMLAGAAVGTVDVRSITQPIRNVSRTYD